MRLRTFLSITFGSLALLFCGDVRAQEAKPADVTFNDSGTIYFVSGQSKEIKVSGKKLSVLSIEATPPGGVNLREAKEFVFDPKSHLSMRKGYKLLVLTIDITADAQAGDRSIVLVTPEGRSKPHPISIRDHVPVISNLKTTVISRSKKEIKIEFDFSDSAGDINSESPPQIAFVCDTLYFGQAFGFPRLEALTMKDDKSGSISTGARLTGLSQNICFLHVRITDKNKNQSDDASITLEFK